MSTKTSASNLGQALKELRLDWQQTKTHWRDIKSQEFEQAYLDVLPEHIARAVTVIEELDVLLRKVNKDCE
jgi:hypothetical protein